MNLRYFFLALVVPFAVVLSCTGSDDTQATDTENIAAASAMTVEISFLRTANDSLLHHHEGPLYHHFDSIYHHHDSLYVQHHDDYHHGDTIHHSEGHHNENQHHEHDSIATAHHHIAHQ